MLKPGWLKRQLEKVEEDVKKWPAWMQREAGLMAKKTRPAVACEKKNEKEKRRKPASRETDAPEPRER